MAEGGGYSGPLVYRDGEGMRPDVAAAFDRMSAAARHAGSIWSSSRASARTPSRPSSSHGHPDPRWVAPPGHSLHRCATELDLGPSSAYGWLAANARRFGFVQRYSWEAWHYGFAAGPPPCSQAGNALSPDGEARRRRKRRGAAELRPGAVPGGAAALGLALERLARTARRAGDGRVGLQPEGRVPGRRPRHRPVHAGHRALLRAARPVRPDRLDRCAGAPDVGPAASLPLRPACARRLQRGRGGRRGLLLHPPTRRPAPTWRASWPWPTGQGSCCRRRSKCG